ncbi:MAG: diacylglycerol kinase family lipid kinase [Clostridia bacterium]|nr:diacylglycerol kinase family lipid kinase [Clostridia bacterium]
MYHLIINGLNSDEKLNAEIDTVKKVFNIAGKELQIHKTEHKGHAREIAASLTENGEFAHLIAMGGDGTLHEVLNGIKDVENCTLGLIPVGSGNDFAETCRISSNVKEAAETIAFRAPTNIDFIETEGGLRSINAVGAGIDVDTLLLTYKSKKHGKSKYLSAFLKTLRKYKPNAFKASWDDEEEREFNGFIACLGNGKQFGGGIKICPEAKIDDGYIDLLLVNYVSRIKLLGALLKLKSGKIHKIKEATYVRCKSVKITPLGDVPPIQAEGEIYYNHPLNAHIVEGKLKFYLPRQAD